MKIMRFSMDRDRRTKADRRYLRGLGLGDKMGGNN